MHVHLQGVTFTDEVLSLPFIFSLQLDVSWKVKGMTPAALKGFSGPRRAPLPSCSGS